MSVSKPVVVDTNVLLVANKMNEQASPQCILSCIKIIRQIREQEYKLVLDDLELILFEYGKKLKAGPSGSGKVFYEWLKSNRHHCDRVSIKLIENENNFEEFPKDEALIKFHDDDRKFVAVALAHPDKPSILNAVDTDWADYEAALTKHGIKIDFLCPEHKHKITLSEAK